MATVSRQPPTSNSRVWVQAAASAALGVGAGADAGAAAAEGEGVDAVVGPLIGPPAQYQHGHAPDHVYSGRIMFAPVNMPKLCAETYTLIIKPSMQ